MPTMHSPSQARMTVAGTMNAVVTKARTREYNRTIRRLSKFRRRETLAERRCMEKVAESCDRRAAFNDRGSRGMIKPKHMNWARLLSFWKVI